MGVPGKATVEKQDYKKYIQSSAWASKRKAWWASALPKECYVCGLPQDASESNKLDLHHRTYKNLGNERLMDLVPVHRRCHEFVHRLYEEGDKRKGLWYYTKEARKRIIRKKNPPKKRNDPLSTEDKTRKRMRKEMIEFNKRDAPAELPSKRDSDGMIRSSGQTKIQSRDNQQDPQEVIRQGRIKDAPSSPDRTTQWRGTRRKRNGYYDSPITS